MSDLETTRCHAWEYFWSIGNFDVFILHPRHGESLKFDGHVPWDFCWVDVMVAQLFSCQHQTSDLPNTSV